MIKRYRAWRKRRKEQAVGIAEAFLAALDDINVWY